MPTAPDVGDRLMLGTTLKLAPLLAPPSTVTTTMAVVAADGTDVTIDVDFHVVAVAATPLNVTVLDPCGLPNPVPLIVTEVPTIPEVTDRLVILGRAVPVPVRLTI